MKLQEGYSTKGLLWNIFKVKGIFKKKQSMPILSSSLKESISSMPSSGIHKLTRKCKSKGSKATKSYLIESSTRLNFEKIHWKKKSSTKETWYMVKCEESSSDRRRRRRNMIEDPKEMLQHVSHLPLRIITFFLLGFLSPSSTYKS